MGKASNTVVFIQNRCPHSHLDLKTLEEAFFGKKPDLKHLRIFGCPIYIHIPKEKRTKLEPSRKRGIFVGYSETSKAYRIYIPGQRNIELSRDVIFDEDTAFKRSKDENESNSKETLGVPDSDIERETLMEEDNSVEPMDLTHMSKEKKRPLWARKLIEENSSIPFESIRERKCPNIFSSYIALMSEISKSEPSDVKVAMKQQNWKDAMTEEYNSILKNDVWEIVPRPKNKSDVSSKWLFKIKHAADVSIGKYKARFVVRGFSQKEGINYEETFAPVAKYTSVRTVIAIVASKGWKIHQMDVKTAFLNGIIEEEVYLEQPKGFVVNNKQTHVCKLKKALYRLKQAPWAWYERIDHHLTKLGFTKNNADSNLYFKVLQGDMLIMVLYVDDHLITWEDYLIDKYKQDLASEFDMKDLGLLHYFLGLEVWQHNNEILNQG